MKLNAGTVLGSPPAMVPTPPILTVELLEGDVPSFRRFFSGSFSIGRGVDCALRIESQEVSRTHAELYVRDGGWWIRDLKSTNGTWLDGERVDEAPVPSEARVQFGKKGPIVRFSTGAR